MATTLLASKVVEGIRPAITINVSNNTCTTSNAQSYFGGSSFTNNGGNGLALVASADTSKFAFGTNPFTVEYFVRLNSIGGIQIIFGTRPTGSQGYYPTFVQYNNVHQMYLNGGTRLSTSITANTWTHIAFVKSGNTYTMYKDGNSVSTYTNATSLGASKAQFFSDDYQPGFSSLNGYVDELRISNTARYTGNFTVTTQPFVNDDVTIVLMHGDQANGSENFIDDNT